jgi:hypothetical protein
MRPPRVYRDRRGLAGARGFKQNVSQPGCVAVLKVEGLAEYPGLVPASRVRWVQAIALDLADIEDGLLAVWQMLRHNGRLASRPVRRKRISDTAPEKGCEYLDIQARPRMQLAALLLEKKAEELSEGEAKSRVHPKRHASR